MRNEKDMLSDANTFKRYLSSTGAEIFRLPLEAFPRFTVYAFVVLVNGKTILIDTGSGMGNSQPDLEAGFRRIREEFHHDVRPETLDHIIISHAHIDHQGGLPLLKKQAPLVTVTAHTLSIPVLVAYEEYRSLLNQRLKHFLRQAGARPDERKTYLELYDRTRGDYTDTPVEYALRDGDTLFDAIEVIHAPGHAPGLLMFRVGDILISTDHFLPDTSVTLWPDAIFPYSGIGLYLEGLERAMKLDGVKLALGSHERSMPDYREIIATTRQMAFEKIERVHDLLEVPRTILEVTKTIYPDMKTIPMLKVAQTGARVEYLHQRGMVAVQNLEEISKRPATPYLFARR